MNLVVFDIDGHIDPHDGSRHRVLPPDGVDELLGLDTGQLQWSDFPHVTDTGVLDVLFRKAQGAPPTRDEHDRFLDRFFQFLEAEHRRTPARFHPVPGAAEMLQNLRTREEWSIALATGAWRRTAQFKLDAAGIDTAGLPFATSDDHHTRAGIVTQAIRRAEVAAGVESGFEAIVAIGDGAWDVTTAQELGISFIGVGPRSVWPPSALNAACATTPTRMRSSRCWNGRRRPARKGSAGLALPYTAGGPSGCRGQSGGCLRVHDNPTMRQPLSPFNSVNESTPQWLRSLPT